MAGWNDDLFTGALQSTALPRDGCCPAVKDEAVAPLSPGADGSRPQRVRGDVPAAPAAGSSSQQSTPPTRTKRKAAASACIEGSEQKAPRADRKRLPKKESVTWDAVPMSSKGMDIGCVFIEADKSVVNGEAQKTDREPPRAIPMWPQYTMTFRGVPVPDSTWIHVSKSERWVRMMADGLTNSNVRDVVAGMLQELSRGLSWRPSLKGPRWCREACGAHVGAHRVPPCTYRERTTYVRTYYVRTHVLTCVSAVPVDAGAAPLPPAPLPATSHVPTGKLCCKVVSLVLGAF